MQPIRILIRCGSAGRWWLAPCSGAMVASESDRGGVRIVLGVVFAARCCATVGHAWYGCGPQRTGPTRADRRLRSATMTSGDSCLLGVDFGTSTTIAMLRWPDGRVRPLLFDGSPL